MSITYFISDVHLGSKVPPEEQERVDRFNQLLRHVGNDADRIFFVGDLFDFWYEYKYAIPKNHFSVLHQLAILRDQGIEMHYLAGNHDFFLGSFFDRELKIKTWANEWTGEIENKKFYLFHGDGVAKKDVGYRILKKILRNRINQRIFRLIHPDLGFPLARKVSGTSRHYTDHLRLNDHSDYIEFAKDRFKEGFDYVVMGHRHNPINHEWEGHHYINIGDFMYNFTYARFDGHEIRLHYVEEELG
jgi:UDP-2,3-diacylglucosamine hydrolase